MRLEIKENANGFREGSREFGCGTQNGYRKAGSSNFQDDLNNGYNSRGDCANSRENGGNFERRDNRNRQSFSKV